MADLSVVMAPVNGGAALEDNAVPAAVGGDTAPCGPGRFLYVMNGDASPHTATVDVTRKMSGLAVEDAVLTVAAGESGVLPLTRNLASADGRAAITYDAVTSVNVAVFELGR
ncbi:hypothetical protein [Streptomyces sp. WMMC897]|uniref:hypothetical protein n=1 Tax=Streptomyces sp. WMMC897 TaxID=3014782 RepID=UPI0022B71555|nr:hypothetical protein [Streptomyces sp. WMMC897]MCZ7414313.1 hypothetical protein [Streptomyces sp. WMMC897]